MVALAAAEPAGAAPSPIEGVGGLEALVIVELGEGDGEAGVRQREAGVLVDGVAEGPGRLPGSSGGER